MKNKLTEYVLSTVDGGISNTLQEVIEEAIDLGIVDDFYGKELEYLEELDTVVFICEACDWLCPIDDMRGDMICEDCS
jgi:hypothetical protein